MAKKRKASGGNPAKREQLNPKKTTNWSKWLQRTAFLAVFFGIVGISFAAYSHLVQQETDLSVIGNGTATVVQVHDPKCPMCQQLKQNLNAVKGDFQDDIQFRVANMNTQKGRSFAREHNAETVTLLMFNERGRRVNLIEGVTPEDQIHSALSKLARR